MEQYKNSFIQSHKALESFNYNLAVKWAIDLMHEGKESDSIFMLASFSEPIDAFEIKPYVTAVLKELNLVELSAEQAVCAKINFHLIEILNNNTIREQLDSLYDMCLEFSFNYGLNSFYLLYHAWEELDFMQETYYLDGVNSDNIEEILKSEALKWIDMYMKEVVEENDITVHTKSIRRYKVANIFKSLWMKRFFS